MQKPLLTLVPDANRLQLSPEAQKMHASLNKDEQYQVKKTKTNRGLLTHPQPAALVLAQWSSAAQTQH